MGMFGVSGLSWVIALVAGVACVGLTPQPTRADNLADALIGAYNTSGLLDQNRALLRAADEDVGIATAALRPVLDWTMTMARTLSESQTTGFVSNRRGTTIGFGLTAELVLYDSGGRQFNIQAAKETVLATRQSLVSIEQLVLFRAVSAYINVLLQTENVRLRENNLRVLNEELRAAQDRFDVGEVTRTDVALAESRVAAAQANLAEARGFQVNSQSEYGNAVGHLPGTLDGPPNMPAQPASLAAAQEIASRNHPDLLAAQHQVAAAELAVLRSATTYEPTATLRGDFGLTEGYNNTDYNQNAVVSLNFRQTIYQGGALAAQVRRAMANRDATRANLLNVHRDVVQDLDNAFVRFQVAGASFAASGERVRAAQVAFDGIREEATLGARTTLDVLTAEQELLNALTAQISAQAEQYVAAYQVLAAQGLLTAERLGLAVQIYDPTIYYNLSKGAPSVYSKQSRDLNRVLEALGKK